MALILLSLAGCGVDAPPAAKTDQPVRALSEPVKKPDAEPAPVEDISSGIKRDKPGDKQTLPHQDDIDDGKKGSR